MPVSSSVAFLSFRSCSAWIFDFDRWRGDPSTDELRHSIETKRLVGNCHVGDEFQMVFKFVAKLIFFFLRRRIVWCFFW